MENLENVQNWDAIVIGSGLGGLGCATALAKHRWKVLVLEQHYVAGGCTHMFTRKGYHWDVGVHILGQMGKAEIPAKILNWLSDGKIKMEPLGEFYDSVHFPDGFEMKFPANEAKFKEQLFERFPNERAPIEKYFKLVHQASVAGSFYFASKVLPKFLLNTLKPAFKILQKKWIEPTTTQVLNKIGASDKLKAVLASQWGYYGATPNHSSFMIHAITTKHFLAGGFYPVGGAKSFADHLTPVIEAAGGAVRTRSRVEKVLLDSSGKAYGVQLQNGTQIKSPVVISAAGAKSSLSRLLPETVQNSGWGKEIAELKQSPAYVTLYLGFEGDITQGGATKSNQFHFRSWDLEDGSWNVSEKDTQAPFVYISFPSLKDPAHDGGVEKKHTGEMVTFVPWECFEQWKHTRRGKREGDYMEFKKEIQEKMLAHFFEVLPGMRPYLKYHELSTPLSTQFFLDAPQGAIYGLDPTPNRFSTDALQTRTPVDGFYLSGCDVSTLGVVGALVGGILTAGTLETRVLKHLV